MQQQPHPYPATPELEAAHLHLRANLPIAGHLPPPERLPLLRLLREELANAELFRPTLHLPKEH